VTDGQTDTLTRCTHDFITPHDIVRPWHPMWRQSRYLS